MLPDSVRSSTELIIQALLPRIHLTSDRKFRSFLSDIAAVMRSPQPRRQHRLLPPSSAKTAPSSHYSLKQLVGSLRIAWRNSASSKRRCSAGRGSMCSMLPIALASLIHWLPTHPRIQYKIVLMMFLIHTNQCPNYLSNIDIPLRRNLHVNVFVHLPARTKPDSSNKDEARRTIVLGGWCGHLELSTPETVRAIADETAFEWVLKTHFLNIAFNSS